MCAGWVRQFVGVFVVWLFTTLGGMIFIGRWNPLLYYLLGYAGFLFAVELSKPDGVRPKNHRRLRWVSMGGFVVFIYGVVSWVQAVIATMPT
ncbi:hypothetical protein SAMN05443574_108117 [Haloarcula vallismortis]|uniref:Uncharacterized protein n=2 Tax=Haloarcula vallismortis TaxID=28442 RepID=M0JBT5_HALVA|nr:hypothetical protein C437_12535 [Haloarcula vallismortis ATCC 29715]SDW87765.1 hypothetical protein SAMN05443574_108117 [Haloarcula vallismortis]